MFYSRVMMLGATGLPPYTGTRVMMMPVRLGERDSLPRSVEHYGSCFAWLCSMIAKIPKGQVGYLTIDERLVKAGETHRRKGLHVDGVYRGGAGGWGERGLLTVSSVVGCRAWHQTFDGDVGAEGEAEHLKPQCKTPVVLQPFKVYWMNGLCVHESLPMDEDTERTFVRLSMPSNAPWFEGYTENPLGVLPTGPILPRRRFMDA